jgi:glucosyl-3-phosphoglycerate synthase
MADFFQNGSIATLQKLIERPVEALEEELMTFAKQKNIVLLLPSLYSEFEGSAMPHIIEELKKVRYLQRVVLSLDRANEEQFMKVKALMSELPVEVKILWHNGPHLSELYRKLDDSGFKIGAQGKGRSVWMTLLYILADQSVDIIALHDCDIINYKRELPARLIYPLAHPALPFEFSKGYYARVADRLYGRVCRLFYTPLIRALKKILGFNVFLELLDSFRYPLSGEFAFVRTLATGIRISPTWGLEVSMLSEVYQNTSVNRICQVEIMDTYEHKHQKLQRNQPTEGLVRMANDIAKTLFRVLAQDGIVMSRAFFSTLMTTYIQESRKAVENYHALSLINGLMYDRNTEITAVESFMDALKMAEEEFTVDPIGVPMLPAYVRVVAAFYDFSNKLVSMVDSDNTGNS